MIRVEFSYNEPRIGHVDFEREEFNYTEVEIREFIEQSYPEALDIEILRQIELV